MKHFRQTAAHRTLLNKHESHAPVRQRSISGVGAPQTAVGVRTMGASVRQFGGINDVPELEEKLHEVHHPEVKAL